MSYYNLIPADYQPPHPGTPGGQLAPVPGWGMNPLRAGPKWLAANGLGSSRRLFQRRGIRKAINAPAGCANSERYEACYRRVRSQERRGLRQNVTEADIVRECKQVCGAPETYTGYGPSPRRGGYQNWRTRDYASYGDWHRAHFKDYKKQGTSGVPIESIIARWAPVDALGLTKAETQGQQGAVALAAAGGLFVGWAFTWLYWANKRKR